MEDLGGLSNAVSVDRVREALRIVRCMLQDGSEVMEMGYHAPAIHDGSEGRPRLNIPRNQLAYMLERRFTAPQIAGRSLTRETSDPRAWRDLSMHMAYAHAQKVTRIFRKLVLSLVPRQLSLSFPETDTDTWNFFT